MTFQSSFSEESKTSLVCPLLNSQEIGVDVSYKLSGDNLKCKKKILSELNKKKIDCRWLNYPRQW